MSPKNRKPINENGEIVAVRALRVYYIIGVLYTVVASLSISVFTPSSLARFFLFICFLPSSIPSLPPAIDKQTDNIRLAETKIGLAATHKHIHRVYVRFNTVRY